MKHVVACIALLAMHDACAGPAIASSFAVPAIDDVGLVVLVVLVGAVAGWAAKRRR